MNDYDPRTSYVAHLVEAIERAILTIMNRGQIVFEVLRFVFEDNLLFDLRESAQVYAFVEGGTESHG
jgi:hypothetical protein